MKKVYYEKIGNDYIPVAEYDSAWLDSYPKGTHLIICNPGITSRKYNVNPDYAPMIAAGQVALDAISDAMVKASNLKPMHSKITKDEALVWKKFCDEFADRMPTLTSPSCRELASAGVDAMIAEANKLLANPSVKKAHDHLLLISELTKNDI